MVEDHEYEADELLQAGPKSSLPPTHDSVEQLGPLKTEILLSHAVAQRFAVIICPFPGTTYQTPGSV
jgi:hypothetical protein